MGPIASLTFFSIFIMGLLGNVHCLSMCGPLVVASTKDFIGGIYYQIGRLVGYTSLLLTLHLFGKGVIALIGIHQIELYVTLFWGTLLIVIGLFQITSKVSDRPILPAVVQEKINRMVRKSIIQKGPFFTGLLSIFLGCGFLYSTLVALLVFQTLPELIIAITLFWIGTLPSLLGASFFRDYLLKILRGRTRILVPLLLIFLGLFTLYSRHVAIKEHFIQKSCH